MSIHKKLILLIPMFCLTLCARSEALDWFGADKKPKAVKTPVAPTAKASAAAEPSSSAAASVTPAQNLTALTNRVANNRSLSDTEKADLSNTTLQYFPAEADLQSKTYEKDMLYFEQIANDPNMKVADKKTSLEQYFAAGGSAAVSAETTTPAPETPAAKPSIEVPVVESVPEQEDIASPKEEVVLSPAPGPVETPPVQAVEKKEEKKTKKRSSNFA